MKHFLIINGANLNVLGKRETGIYGTQSLQDLQDAVLCKAAMLNVSVEFFQSNIEGEIVNILLKSCDNVNGIIINAGAYTHYSYAIYDAIRAANVPCIEVHISNVSAREEFRKTSVIAPACIGNISGLGMEGYLFALEYLSQRL